MLRRPFLAWLLALGGLGWATLASAQTPLPAIQLYAPQACLACADYAQYLREQGFSVTLSFRDDMAALKQRLRVPKALEAEPTGTLGSYFIEGHVPAEDIRSLLAEQPKARGLAVPGLPMGAPGVEYSAPICDTACTVVDQDQGSRRIRREMFDTLLVKPKGDTAIFARH